MFEMRLSGDTFIIKEPLEIERRIRKMPKRVTKRLGKFVLRSAKVRASPRYRWSASGDLSRHIKISYTKNGFKISAKTRAAYYQEKGFKPHYVPIENLSPRARSMIPDGVSSILVSKHKPFIRPAVEKGLTKIDDWIGQEIKKI